MIVASTIVPVVITTGCLCSPDASPDRAPSFRSYAKHINLPTDELPAYLGSSARIALKVALDETGSPTNISVLHSINPNVDARVVDAVRQFRWSPAVLDNKPVPIDLTLNVEIQRSF